LNNVLIHEIGHTVDDRNSSFLDRERFANWFAVEYGYRASRGRR
jgi:predicted metalloendopeptidase